MSISASAVKELREKSGAGMLDCKKALEENGGDIETAMEWLRKKGIASAEKKSGRAAAEGLVSIAVSADNKKAAIVELNSETDFVAKNEEFQAAATQISKNALETDGSLESVLDFACPTAGKKVSEAVTDLVAKIGENINLRRSDSLSSENGIVASYIHSAAAPGLGKIGVLVALEGADEAKLLEVGKQVAMHVAAAKPEALSRDEVPSDKIEKEKEIFAEQAKAEGKPENIIEKMVEGRINKFYGEIVLPEQVFVIDGKAKVSEFLAQQGADIKITGFKLFILGEGVEKKEENFAAEVAAAAAGA